MPYFTVKETADQIKLSKSRIRLFLGQGRFPGAGKFVKNDKATGRGKWLIPETDIEAFLATPRTPGKPRRK